MESLHRGVALLVLAGYALSAFAPCPQSARRAPDSASPASHAADGHAKPGALRNGVAMVDAESAHGVHGHHAHATARTEADPGPPSRASLIEVCPCGCGEGVRALGSSLAMGEALTPFRSIEPAGPGESRAGDASPLGALNEPTLAIDHVPIFS